MIEIIRGILIVGGIVGAFGLLTFAVLVCIAAINGN